MSTFDASVTITIWAMILLYDPYQFNLYVFDLMDQPLTDTIDPYLEALFLSSAQQRSATRRVYVHYASDSAASSEMSSATFCPVIYQNGD